MAKTPPKTSRWRRSFGWFGRHKVTAVFAALVFVGVLYLGGSWAILQVQIHFERERFNNAADEVSRLESIVAGETSPTIYSKKSCTHSSFGGIFEIDTIACDSEARLVYTNAQKSEATNYARNALATLAKQGVNPRNNLRGSSSRSVASYEFTYQRLDCFLDILYYDQQTPAMSRGPGVPGQGAVTLIDIDCGGKARLDYFPISDS